MGIILQYLAINASAQNPMESLNFTRQFSRIIPRQAKTYSHVYLVYPFPTTVQVTVTHANASPIHNPGN
jgi:YbbR domain-containing protein